MTKEKYYFLDDKGDPIEPLTYEEWNTSWQLPKIRDLIIQTGLTAITVEYLGVDKKEQDRILHNIHAVREETSGIVLTREQIIDAVRANPGSFFPTLECLFLLPPDLDDLKKRFEEGRKPARPPMQPGMN